MPGDRGQVCSDPIASAGAASSGRQTEQILQRGDRQPYRDHRPRVAIRRLLFVVSADDHFHPPAIYPRRPHTHSNKSSHRLQPSHRALHRFYLSRCRLILSVTAHPIKGGALFHHHPIVGDVASDM